ncbi:hypothetical protein Y032_0091g2470 [Ancylostoma ceylanicum]|uniref:Uncharacterized protein n=2 Tax=Ancylostoma ceylanicum TaxID=53326 RepID=A0A016TMW2_9BILA|nr:hypothetical protein Y032_0091g2470 [Ancylostoma ceylanicum]
MYMTLITFRRVEPHETNAKFFFLKLKHLPLHKLVHTTHLAQRNDHIRMLQLRIPRSGSHHDERPRSRAAQEEVSGFESSYEQRGRSEESEQHQALCPPLQHLGSACFDLRFGNLGIT